jgi:hypothetical protein
LFGAGQIDSATVAIPGGNKAIAVGLTVDRIGRASRLSRKCLIQFVGIQTGLATAIQQGAIVNVADGWVLDVRVSFAGLPRPAWFAIFLSRLH